MEALNSASRKRERGRKCYDSGVNERRNRRKSREEKGERIACRWRAPTSRFKTRYASALGVSTCMADPSAAVAGNSASSPLSSFAAASTLARFFSGAPASSALVTALADLLTSRDVPPPLPAVPVAGRFFPLLDTLIACASSFSNTRIALRIIPPEAIPCISG